MSALHNLNKFLFGTTYWVVVLAYTSVFTWVAGLLMSDDEQYLFFPMFVPALALTMLGMSYFHPNPTHHLTRWAHYTRFQQGVLVTIMAAVTLVAVLGVLEALASAPVAAMLNAAAPWLESPALWLATATAVVSLAVSHATLRYTLHP